MRRLLLITIALLVIGCGQNQDRKVLESEDGLQPVDIFDTPDGWTSCLSSEITTTTWDYELNEDSGDYWWIYYYDSENATIYHPVTENGAITGTFIPYIWDGMSFAPEEKAITAEELSIL